MFFECRSRASQCRLDFCVAVRLKTFREFAGCGVDRCNGHVSNLSADYAE